MGQAERERIVKEHMEAESRQDAAATVATFSSPRYEVVPTGEVHEGPHAVQNFLQETMKAFPDLRFELHALHHTTNAVIVEATFHATHLGSWRGLPPTERHISYRMCNIFVFEGDNLICERIYFDLLTALRAAGVARDPMSLSGKVATFLNHPVTLLCAAARSLRKML